MYFGFAASIDRTWALPGGLFSERRKYEVSGRNWLPPNVVSVRNEISYTVAERTSAIAQQPKSKCGISKTKRNINPFFIFPY